MNIKKYLTIGAVALSLGFTSCVGDLNLEPNDPNLADPDSPEFTENGLAMCYAGIAVSGVSGPGSSYVGGLDAGASAYLRLIFSLSEFCTDEVVWIWPADDSGSAGEITSCTWGANNVWLEGTYYRLMGHIAICNWFLGLVKDATSPEDLEMQAEARTLRAYSYYNMIDLFGKCSFITEEAEYGEQPEQYTREQMYEWLEKELVDIVDNSNLATNPELGRVGKDGAEALLAKLYLNGQVWTGNSEYWAKCQQRCSNIIARHQGSGFNGTGLAENYLYLFCRNNEVYLPGGSRNGENEILFGIRFNDTYTQSYGGPTFIIASTISNTHYIPRQNYGCSSEWSCIRGKQQMAEKFAGLTNDVRNDLWVTGNLPAGSNEATGETWEEEKYQDTFIDFTGNWRTCGGNAIIKFTGRIPDAAWDGGWDMEATIASQSTFASTSQPIIRLADIYLMYAECYLNGQVGDQQLAMQYWNNVRNRAGIGDLMANEFNIDGLMNERSRELYLESWRRNDLIRNGKFAGPEQDVWQIKGSLDNMEGTRIAVKNNVYPVPLAVIAAQPEFKQNDGY